MPRCSRRSPLLAFLLLAACAGGGGGSTGSLSVLPRTATVTAGAGTVTFTAAVSGDATTAVWTVAGGGSVSPTMGLTTIYTPPERVDVDTTVTVTAQANELTDTVTVTVKPAPPAPVGGRVIRMSGRPVEGATVTIPGAGSATTAADGSFTIAGVRVPYDLAVRGYQNLFVVYLGLHRRDPTAMLYVAGIEDARPAVGLSGQVTGGAGWELPYRTAVAFGSPDTDWLLAWLQLGNAWNAWPLCWSTAGEFGGYAVSCPIAAAQSAVRLTALQWKVDAGGMPLEYTGFGTLDFVTLAADASLDGQYFGLGDAPATVHLSGTATAAARLAVRARFGDAVLPIAFQEAAPASFQYATPGLADELQLTLTQGSTTANPLDEYNVGAYRGGLAPDASGVSIAVPGPPNPMAPVFTADDAVFPIQVMGGGYSPVYVAILTCNGMILTVVTTRSSVALSELPSLGVSFPSRAACSWSVFATSAASTVDQAAGPQGYLVRTQGYAWGRGVDLAFTSP